MIYTVAVYNNAGDRLTVMRDVKTPTYSRSKNTADQVSFSIPRDSSNIQFIETGRRFEILRTIDGQTEVEQSGFISNHGYGDNYYDVEGYSEEIVLTRQFTPAQYGFPLYSQYADLDSLARQLGRTFVVEQAKYRWDDFIVQRTNVDTTTVPAFIILEKDSGGDYPSTGSVTFRFEKQPDEEWDRIRWVSDFDEDEENIDGITTFVSIRTANTIGALGAFSQAQAGSLPDVVGLIIPGSTDRYLEVKFDLLTDTPELSPAVFSLEVIKRGPGAISTFDIDPLATSIQTPKLVADNSSFFEVLTAACEPSGFEFMVVNGKLMLAQTFGVDRSNDYSVVSS